MSQESSYEKGILSMGQKLQEGELPSNDQIQGVLEKVKSTVEEQKFYAMNEPRCEEVKSTLDTTSKVISSAQQLLQEKNSDEILQQTLKDYIQAGQQVKETVSKGWWWSSSEILSEKDTDLLKERTNEITMLLRGLSLDLIRSSETRDLLNEAFDIIKNLLIRTTNKMGGQEEISQLGKEALHPLQEVVEEKREIPSGVEETTQRVSETATDVTSKMKEGWTWVELTEEEKNKLFDRVLSWFSNIMKHNSTRRTFNNMGDLIDDFYDRLNSKFDFSSVDLSNKRWLQEHFGSENEMLRKSFQDTKILLERFSGKSINTLIDSFTTMTTYLFKNEEARQYFYEMREMFHNVQDDPDVIKQESFQQNVKRLIDRSNKVGKSFTQNDYVENFLRESSNFLNCLQNDPSTKRMIENTNKWISHFVRTGEGGKTELDMDLIASLRNVIVPLVMDQFKSVPLPPFRYSDSSVEITVYGSLLTFKGPPDSIEINQKSSLRVEFSKQEITSTTSQSGGYIEIKLNNICMNLDNVRYSLERKLFPKLTDYGRLRMEIGDRGMSLTILLDTSNPTQKPYFIVKDVNCYIDSLSISLQESQHSIIMGLMTIYYQTYLRKTLERRIENEVYSAFERIEYTLSQAIEQLPAFSSIQQNVMETIKAPFGEKKITDVVKDIVTGEKQPTQSPHGMQRVRT